MKHLFFFFFSFSFFFFLFSSLSNGAVTVVKTITVDGNGHGDFNTIQAAINTVPDGNNKWIRIHVKAGVYKEQVDLPFRKGFVVLEGEGASQTSIEWDEFVPLSLDNDRNALEASATFTSAAPNVVLKGIAFKVVFGCDINELTCNSRLKEWIVNNKGGSNTYGNSTKKARAVAALISGDKTSIYNCNFIGIQDTLCDFFGRHYFKDCYIEGAVDTIFGMAQSIYEGCSLVTVASDAIAGWVTAQGRGNESDPNGFVFKNCNLTGSAKTFLGRAWGNYARVVFYQTFMSNIVVPQGWDKWNSANGGALTTFAESGCSGPGSNTGGRVKWEKQLSNNDLQKLTSISFIDDGWLSQQP